MKSAITYLYASGKSAAEEREQKREWRKTQGYDAEYLQKSKGRKSVFAREGRQSAWYGRNGERENGRRFTVSGVGGAGTGTGVGRGKFEREMIGRGVDGERKGEGDDEREYRKTDSDRFRDLQLERDEHRDVDGEGREKVDRGGKGGRWRKSVISMFQPALKRGDF